MQPVLTKLAQLRRTRLFSRLLIGSCWLLILLAGVLGSIFIVDWFFEPGTTYRVILLLIGLVAASALVVRSIVPWFSQRESIEQLALDIEHQQQWPDLIAAIQFDRRLGDAKNEKSSLKQSVIQRVSQQHERISFDDPRLTKTRKTVVTRSLVVAVVILLGTLFAFEHLRVFARRIFLASHHYPTQTKIEAVSINGVTVLDSGDPSLSPRPATIVQNEKTQIAVLCRGQVPEAGVVDFLDSDGQRNVNLRPIKSPAASDEAARSFEADLGKATTTLKYRIRVGDAWTEWGELIIKPLPIVTLELSITPPDYAAANHPARSTSDRDISIAPGSKVSFQIRSGNNKPLREVRLRLTPAESPSETIELVHDIQTNRWTTGDDRALRDLRKSVQYELVVVDVDGLSPATPITGEIACLVDQPPTITASSIHRLVTAHAQPVVDIETFDDFGIAGIAAVLEVISDNGSEPNTQAGPRRLTIPVDLPDPQIVDGKVRIATQLKVPVDQLTVLPDEQIRVTFTATDERGDPAGETTTSDPIVWTVTDDKQLVHSVLQDDDEIERQLSELIQLQKKVERSE